MARTQAELSVDIPFAATDIDKPCNLGGAANAIQRLQYPALPGTIGWQEELVVHPMLTLTSES